LIVALIGLIVLWKGIVLVRDDQVGIQTKKMLGAALPQGKIIACNGEVGIQADTLMPGLYFRIPFVWSIKKVKVTVIESSQVGVVEAIDGNPLEVGRLLGDQVTCDSYQDAKAFLGNGGRKGPQIAILNPGTYRINTEVFKVTTQKRTDIPTEKIGVLIAKDGIPLPPGRMIAPVPEGDCSHFQDGQAFVENGGYRGPQRETLQAGSYYINPLLFSVEIHPIADVPPGHVAVLRSNDGEEIVRGEVPDEVDGEPNFSQPLNANEVVLATNKNQRGILADPVSPGKYNMNPLAFTAYVVPTSAITIDWADDKRRQQISETNDMRVNAFFGLNEIGAISRDGFTLKVDVRMVIRIKPEHAPYIIARFGSVDNLIEQIAHPLIDSTFRNNAGEKNALDFVYSRTELQREALEKARKEFENYHVEAQNLLIAYIDVDERLLETQKLRQIAEQETSQYAKQAEAEEKRITVEEKRARAEKQPEVIEAELSIKIAEDKAKAMVMEANGIKESTITKAEGEAYSIEKVGAAKGQATKAQTDVLGLEGVVMLEMAKSFATSKQPLVPEIFVVGGEHGDGSSGATLALMTQVIKDLKTSVTEQKVTEKVTRKDIVEHQPEVVMLDNPDHLLQEE
jgi:uncharacterized membrane protein YqiK